MHSTACLGPKWGRWEELSNQGRHRTKGVEMKPCRGIPLFRTLFANFFHCRQCCHLSFFTGRSTHLAEWNTFQHNCLWNTVTSIVVFNNWSRRYNQASRTLWHHDALQKYLQTLCQEYQNIGLLLNDSSVNEHRQRALSKRHAELSPLAVTFKEIQEAKNEIQDLEILCASDICQQFTKEVFEMYQNYADYRCWTFEIQNYTPADYGDHVYKHLKYEGGIHRVQRIPETGLSSRMQRIHTGTMSVIVLPQPEEVKIKIDPRDLRIDTFRAKGAGGQHVNTTDSAVRIVHIPTGLTVECQQERSQVMNKETALRTLREKLYKQTIERELGQKQKARKLQLGTRSQSERIRTYNFSQDRVTDHRISYEVRNIKEFLCGKELLDNLINKVLETAEMESLIEHMENNFISLKADS
ncbi:peptide chain release factor 1, mitochondrial isoform X12 [Hemicordylus capensis]|uniref:peptide chain release factor 1, mitochondrial isoform X12 n=1 Tax=Hemicordylus capensis TaxID=884348 RepID=UPI002304CECC|nr:peptide chain release factor 1, mitochondrial isoform X12 [Hemicordylus capensis]